MPAEMQDLQGDRAPGQPPPPRSLANLVPRLGRLPLVLGALLWSTCFAAMFRTSTFGMSGRDAAMSLVATLILSAPIAPFAFLGLGWRRLVLGVLLVCTAAVGLAELFARAQEVLVVRQYGAKPAEKVHVPRWWPFGNHSIVYSPERGWSATD